jgi:putative aldouronate transport system substrate-binding protein
MNKRLFALVACAAISASMLAGCAKSNATDNKSSDTKESTQSETTKGEATEAETAKVTLPYQGDPVVFKGFAADLGIKEVADSPVMTEYNKRVGNVKIEWDTAPWSDFDTKAQLYLNSGDMPDIMWRSASTTIANYGSSGLFLDWNKYKEYMPNWQKHVNEYPNLLDFATEKGEVFAVTDVEPLDAPGESWYYNKTMLDKYNIAPPKTLEEMVDAMKKLKELDPKVIPYQSYWNYDYILDAFGQATGAKTGFLYNEKTSKWEYAPLSADSGYKELISLVAEMNKDKLFNPEVATMSWEQELQAIASNNWAFAYFYVVAPENEIYKTNNLPIEIKPLTAPSYNGKSLQRITNVFDSSPSWGFFASAKVKNPELLAAFIDNTVSKETSELFNWGVEGVTFKRDSNGFKEFIPEIMSGEKNPADFGIGNIMSPRYIQYKDRASEIAKYGPLGKESYKLLVDNFKSGTVTPILDRSKPIMTTEQNEELGKIMTPINTYVTENQLKFLTGERPISEWDDFASKIKDMGDINKALEIYNSAKQLERATERKYVEVK